MSSIIKQIPEDFKVEEIPFDLNEGNGNYNYFILEKTGLNTLEAVKAIAKKAGIKVNSIGWAGNKDKNAITKQLISFYRVKKELVEKLSLPHINLTYFGTGSNEIALGKLLGNKFTITLRNLDEDDCNKIKTNYVLLKKQGIPNYFDEQRFGGNNPETGKLILQGNFNEAAVQIFEETTSADKLRQLHKSQLLLYVHAYQSLLFNKLLHQYIESNSTHTSKITYSRGTFVFPNDEIKNKKLPVIGFGTELPANDLKILEAEHITTRNFVIKQFPDISSEGTLRDAFAKITDFELGSSESDELNSGMKKITLSFSLPKGSYATIVVKALNC